MAIRLLLFLTVAVLIYFVGRRWWIDREATKLTEVFEETPNAIPYFAKEKTYANLSDQQRQQLEAILPPPYSRAHLRPCRVTMDDGTEYACVFIIPAQEFIDTAWRWPEDVSDYDPVYEPVNVERIIRIEESHYRVPPHIAEQIKVHDLGERGGMRFVAEFSSGDRWRYRLNDQPEFLTAPAGLTFADVVAITATDEDSWKLPKGRALEYRWCLHGHGIPPKNVRIRKNK